MARPKNSTENMHPAELRGISQTVGNLRSLSIMTGVPYRSLQDYASGLAGIPLPVATAARQALKRDRDNRARIVGNIEARIDQQFPASIPSTPESEGE